MRYAICVLILLSGCSDPQDLDAIALQHPLAPHAIYNEAASHKGQRVAVTGKITSIDNSEVHLKNEDDLLARAFFFMNEDASHLKAGDTITAVGTCGDVVLLQVKLFNGKIISVTTSP